MISQTRFISDGHWFDISERDLDGDTDIDLADASRLLNDKERQKAESFVFPRDQHRYVRARGFLRQRLGTCLGQNPERVAIDELPGGKPVVRDVGVRFNLSHSAGVLAVVLTNGPDVGIDVEVDGHDRMLGSDLPDLADACLTQSERIALFSTPPADRTHRFLTYWTAKEARMKLNGEGFALDPRKVELDLKDGQPVGYLRPGDPGSRLRYIRLCSPTAVCCLAF